MSGGTSWKLNTNHRRTHAVEENVAKMIEKKIKKEIKEINYNKGSKLSKKNNKTKGYTGLFYSYGSHMGLRCRAFTYQISCSK